MVDGEDITHCEGVVMVDATKTNNKDSHREKENQDSLREKKKHICNSNFFFIFLYGI